MSRFMCKWAFRLAFYEIWSNTITIINCCFSSIIKLFLMKSMGKLFFKPQNIECWIIERKKNKDINSSVIYNY